MRYSQLHAMYPVNYVPEIRATHEFKIQWAISMIILLAKRVDLDSVVAAHSRLVPQGKW